MVEHQAVAEPSAQDVSVISCEELVQEMLPGEVAASIASPSRAALSIALTASRLHRVTGELIQAAALGVRHERACQPIPGGSAVHRTPCSWPTALWSRGHRRPQPSYPAHQPRELVLSRSQGLAQTLEVSAIHSVAGTCKT
jgi:hypothetical protein